MVATISPTTLADLRRQDNKLTLIDVRTPAEFGEVHVDFAHTIPLDRLDLQAVKSVAGAGPVYFVCKSGTRSQRPAKSCWPRASRTWSASRGARSPARPLVCRSSAAVR